jgi:uncharacterized protein (TIGR03545 family)
MRWKGFITLVVLLIAGSIVSGLFIDRWMERGLERTGQLLVGARVEIDNLDIRLLDLSIQWDRLQVTDPGNTMQNLIETGRVAYRMHLPALLRKRFIIEEMTLAGVRCGTPRDYDGRLPKKKKPISRKPGTFDKIKDRLISEVEQLPVMRFDPKALQRSVNIDSLIALTDLKLVERIDSVKVDVIQTAEKWEDFYEGFRPEEDLKKIRADFDGVDPKQIKTVPELVSVLEKVQSAQKRLNTLSKTVDTRTSEIHADFDRIGSYREKVDRWVDDDYRAVLAKAELPDLSAKNIGKTLFGVALVHQVSHYLDYLDMIQKVIPKKSGKPQKEKKPRMAGQMVSFPDRHGWPTFLIRRIHLSGQTGADDESPGLAMQGEARGITSQPWVYGSPTLIDLKGIREDDRSLYFTAVLDHTTEMPKDSFGIRFENIPLNNVSIQTTPHLPNKIKEGRADFGCTTQVQGDRFSIRVDTRARGLRFDFTEFETNDVFSRVVHGILSGMDLLTLRAKIVSRGDDMDFEVDSNVDHLVARELERMASQTFVEAENRIRSRVRRIRDQKMAGLNEIFDEKRKEVEGPLDAYKGQADDMKSRIEGKIKELVDDAERRKKRELGDRAKKLLEGLIKKK